MDCNSLPDHKPDSPSLRLPSVRIPVLLLPLTVYHDLSCFRHGLNTNASRSETDTGSPHMAGRLVLVNLCVYTPPSPPHRPIIDTHAYPRVHPTSVGLSDKSPSFLCYFLRFGL